MKKKTEAGDCDFSGHPPASDITLVCVCLRPSTVGKHPALILLSALLLVPATPTRPKRRQSWLLRLLLSLPMEAEPGRRG